LAREEETLARVVKLFEQRVNAGRSSQPELYLAQSSLRDAKLKSIEIVSRVSVDRDALSAALGIPVRAIDGVAFSWSPLETPLDYQSLSPAEIRRLALLNRIDLRRELAQYAAADEALKLEIAKQYPDINLADGYSWEGGENIFELGPSAVLPVFNQNQGPIAEAEARRREVAAQVLAMQAGVIEQFADGPHPLSRGTWSIGRGAHRCGVSGETTGARQDGRLRSAKATPSRGRKLSWKTCRHNTGCSTR
jgi:outer membrane protein TolC